MGASGSGLEAIGLARCGRNVSPILSQALKAISRSHSLIMKGQNTIVRNENSMSRAEVLSAETQKVRDLGRHCMKTTE